MDKIREKVTDFMEHNEYLSKLKNKQWYDMEDSLVNLVEEISDKKKNTYNGLDRETEIALYKAVLKEYEDCCEWLNKRLSQGNTSLKTLCEELKGWNLFEGYGQENVFDFSYRNKDITLSCFEMDKSLKIDTYVEFYDKDKNYYAMTIADIKKELKELGVEYEE